MKVRQLSPREESQLRKDQRNYDRKWGKTFCKECRGSGYMQIAEDGTEGDCLCISGERCPRCGTEGSVSLYSPPCTNCGWDYGQGYPWEGWEEEEGQPIATSE